MKGIDTYLDATIAVEEERGRNGDCPLKGIENVKAETHLGYPENTSLLFYKE